MKKITLFIVAFLCLNISFAQDALTEEIEIVQNLFGAEKRTIIEENINLDGVDSAAFWKIYDAYEIERKEIGKQKLINRTPLVPFLICLRICLLTFLN